MIELLSKWRRSTARLSDTLGRNPTNAEVARLLGVSKKKLPIIEKAIHVNDSTPQTDQSESGWSLSEVVMDEATSMPDEIMMKDDALKFVRERLEAMEEREATVLKMRFGLDNQQPRTLKEIGEHLGLTRERVRQIETACLKRLGDELQDPRDQRHFKLRSA